MGYKFNGTKFITRGIKEDLPAVLVMYLWNIIDERISNKEVPMDYLQIFELRQDLKDSEKNLVITLRQEEPTHVEVHSINHFTEVTRKVYIIDDIDHVTMLLAEEY